MTGPSGRWRNRNSNKFSLAGGSNTIPGRSQTQLVTAREALAKAGLRASDVAAVGITNQRETTVVRDCWTGVPIYYAIVWQDRRTAAFCDELRRAGHADLIQRKTGLRSTPISPAQTALDSRSCPGARQRARRGELAFGTIDTWLLWNLTGGALHVTVPSNASRTMLYNLETGAWDAELLRLLDVPHEVLLRVRSSSEVLPDSKELLGAPVTIAGVAGDPQAASSAKTASPAAY